MSRKGLQLSKDVGFLYECDYVFFSSGQGMHIDMVAATNESGGYC